MVPWAHTSPQPKQHLDRFIRFCTAHGCVKRLHLYTLCMWPKSIRGRKHSKSPGLSNQDITWLRTYLFNLCNISFLAIFIRHSNNKLLTLVWYICLLRLTTVYSRLPRSKYLLFSTLIFGSIFRKCLCRLYENTEVSFISHVNVKICNKCKKKLNSLNMVLEAI